MKAPDTLTLDGETLYVLESRQTSELISFPACRVVTRIMFVYQTTTPCLGRCFSIGTINTTTGKARIRECDYTLIEVEHGFLGPYGVTQYIELKMERVT